ncbi:MAG TPA: hypothetical protein PKC14_01970 [Candidatus Absconditabacterales bacterium]|nr:hypothetical protein [Candidatus Absconditabacterales bacterium]
MKVIIPRNIQKGWFSMNFQIGPFTISIIQLFILAIGIGLALATYNAFAQAQPGTTSVIGIVFGIIIFLIFVIIAFFEISELSLIPFLAKMVRTYFLDVPQKHQMNYEKINPTELLIKKARGDEKATTVEQKSNSVDAELIAKVQKDIFE